MGLQDEVCQCCLEKPSCHSGMSRQHEDSHGQRDPGKALQAKDHLPASDVCQTPQHN